MIKPADLSPFVSLLWAALGLRCGARASHCSGFSRCGAQLSSCGACMWDLSSPSRDQTCCHGLSTGCKIISRREAE